MIEPPLIMARIIMAVYSSRAEAYFITIRDLRSITAATRIRLTKVKAEALEVEVKDHQAANSRWQGVRNNERGTI